MDSDYGKVILGFAALVIFIIIVQGHANRKNKEAIARPEVVLVDGCEYLRFSTHAGHSVLTHKGNCKNH